MALQCCSLLDSLACFCSVAVCTEGSYQDNNDIEPERSENIWNFIYISITFSRISIVFAIFPGLINWKFALFRSSCSVNGLAYDVVKHIHIPKNVIIWKGSYRLRGLIYYQKVSLYLENNLHLNTPIYSRLAVSSTEYITCIMNKHL